MIIVDLNQTMISNVMAQLGNHTNTVIEEDLFRHMVLNALRLYKKNFAEYGEMVIACDDKKYWRRAAFPNYKINRKKAREQSELDWNQIFNCLNKIRDELKHYTPFRVLQVEGAEADDIIATLCIKYGSIVSEEEKILILSGDKDFVQLQIYKNVFQYDPVRKKHIKTDDPHSFLREHILKGDRGDGIPNIVSSDDCIANGEKQKPLSSKRIEHLKSIADLSTTLNEVEYKNFKRNEMLIDLHMTPNELQTRILDKFDQEYGKPSNLLEEYFTTFRLKTLHENIGDFL